MDTSLTKILSQDSKDVSTKKQHRFLDCKYDLITDNGLDLILPTGVVFSFSKDNKPFDIYEGRGTLRYTILFKNETCLKYMSEKSFTYPNTIDKNTLRQYFMDILSQYTGYNKEWCIGIVTQYSDQRCKLLVLKAFDLDDFTQFVKFVTTFVLKIDKGDDSNEKIKSGITESKMLDKGI